MLNIPILMGEDIFIQHKLRTLKGGMLFFTYHFGSFFQSKKVGDRRGEITKIYSGGQNAAFAMFTEH